MENTREHLDDYKIPAALRTNLFSLLFIQETMNVFYTESILKYKREYKFYVRGKFIIHWNIFHEKEV